MQLQPRPCLRDELFLLAHKPNGAERVNRPALALALAAATLIDLQMASRITVSSEERLRVIDVRATPDGIANATLEYLSDPDDRDRRNLRTALHEVGNTIYDRTCAWMHISSRVTKQVKVKLLGRNTERYHQTAESIGHVQWLAGMLYYRTQIGKTVDDQSAALCALVAALRLERQVIAVDISDSELLAQLHEPVEMMTGNQGDALRWLIAAANERIGARAVSALG